MRKLIFTYFLFTIVPLIGSSQQQTQYSQYLYNLFAINPAHAGNKDYIQLSMSERNQWAGIEGAPHSQSFTIHAPLNSQKMGVGLNIYNESIGAHGVTGVFGSYSYSLRNSYSKLSFGIRGGIYNYRTNSSKVSYLDANDPYTLENTRTKPIPTFDAGLQYFNKNIRTGLSITNIQETSTFNLNSGALYNNLKRHLYAYFAYIKTLNENWKIRPSSLLKMTANAPVNIDFNLGFIYNNKMHLGLSYRSSKSIIAMAEYYINKNIKLGYSFDYDFNIISKTGSYGTHELMLGIDLNMRKSTLLTPRFL